MAIIRLSVNGRAESVDVDPTTPLLYVLRNDLDLHGPRFGCGLAQCGACTVHLAGKAVRSCSVPLAAAAGKEIVTLEGLAASGQPHPLQQAFIDEQAPQCGYCYNGMLIKGSELLAQTPRPSEAQIRSHMDGHLCRCGSYPRIMKAIQVASTTMAGATR